MGMSSSQARLLTLTARLHSIELKAQKHEAEKLRLANDSDRVYETYLAALEQTKLVANVLADDGSMTYIDLTANAIYNYKTLQNQYSLITKDDKMLIPASIANNYKNTASLSDFLNAYGLQSGFSQTIRHEDPNPTFVDQEKRYNDAMTAWETNHQGWLDRKKAYEQDHNNWVIDKANHEAGHDNYLRELDQWNRDKAQWDIDYANWQAQDPKPKETDTTQRWWVEEAFSLGNDFHEAADSGVCWGSATSGTTSGLSCYRHIMSSIIDFTGSISTADYTTSTGKTGHKLGTSQGGVSGAATLPCGKDRQEVFKEVSKQLNLGIKPKADGETCDVNASSSEYDKLVSKWNPDGSLKTLKQWAIDLDYIAKNYSSFTGFDPAAFSQTLIKFQTSLEGSLLSFKREIFEEAVTEWEDDEPPAMRPMPTWNGTLRAEPTFTEPEPVRPNRDDFVNAPATVPRDEVVNHTTFNDKDKAQWYINVWYRLEGLNDTPKVMVESVHDDATNTEKYIYSCTNKTKSNTTYTTNPDWNVEENENYMVIPDDKLNDPKWLRNAVVEGFVLVQEFDKENNRFFDTSVSVTTRIHELQDETGVKKAEAQYEADMKKIDRKDRYYDTEIAKCENERSAIINELDSLKNVAKENVDRTFKLFS